VRLTRVPSDQVPGIPLHRSFSWEDIDGRGKRLLEKVAQVPLRVEFSWHCCDGVIEAVVEAHLRAVVEKVARARRA